MANSWFRLYSEIINDTKLLAVTEALRWRYVALLCLKCNETIENMPDDEIAIALRITEQEWIDTKRELVKRRLLDENNNIPTWEKRQYISDLKDPTAAERQKRHRDKLRYERNATVTSRLPESDTDTDTNTQKQILRVCQIFKDNNIQGFSSIHPVFQELIKQGVTADEFEFAAKNHQGKKFNYICGVIKNTRLEAASIRLAPKEDKHQWLRNLK